MVKLKNIKIDGNTVKCDIFPEDSEERGLLEVDISENKIINYVLPTGYEWCENHLAHAKRYIVECFRDIQATPIPEKTIMWY